MYVDSLEDSVARRLTKIERHIAQCTKWNEHEWKKNWRNELSFSLWDDHRPQGKNGLRKFAERTANSYSFFSGGGFRFGRSSANCWEIHKKEKERKLSQLSMSSFSLDCWAHHSVWLSQCAGTKRVCQLCYWLFLFLQQIRDSWPPTRRLFFFSFLNPWPLYRAECGAHTTIETSVCCSLCATVIERRASCGITFDSCSWAQLIHWSTQILVGFIRVSIPALSKGTYTHSSLEWKFRKRILLSFYQLS